ncbi:hypothetical protein IQ250_25730 [Pseudanabaenaceae cyanobacterium LEGE 13415]|nr:hypothetical protein [Pseudanabaenaceae cyanobacterium LEGE 13415]
MMPYEWCRQSDDCWLRTLFAQTELSDLPRFRVGQIVEIPYFDLDTQEWKADRGVIVGFAIADALRFSEPGWGYFVRLLNISSSPWLNPNYIEEAHETDLREVS